MRDGLEYNKALDFCQCVTANTLDSDRSDAVRFVLFKASSSVATSRYFAFWLVVVVAVVRDMMWKWADVSVPGFCVGEGTDLSLFVVEKLAAPYFSEALHCVRFFLCISPTRPPWMKRVSIRWSGVVLRCVVSMADCTAHGQYISMMQRGQEPIPIKFS